MDETDGCARDKMIFLNLKDMRPSHAIAKQSDLDTILDWRLLANNERIHRDCHPNVLERQGLSQYL